jgi:carboxymethylenebutenolidase
MTHNLKAETVTIRGFGDEEIEAYLSVPTDVESCGAVVVIHHMPGYDETSKEIVRRFASEGHSALMPNLYHRDAPGASSDDAAAAGRNNGGVPDDRLVGDVLGAMNYLKSLSISNGKTASIGFCSGGRQSVLAGCRLPLEGVIDCYGAFVSVDTSPETPIARKAILGEVGNLSGPVLGLFGADDQYPSPSEVEIFAQALESVGKEYEFHTFDGAGHAFFASDRTSYRPEAAKEGWGYISAFLARTIG